MIKLRNFLEMYGIEAEKEKIMILKSCLEGKALDFYLTLAENEQGNLAVLDEKLQDHFSPKNHNIIEMEKFMKMKKNGNQSVSEFYIYALRPMN